MEVRANKALLLIDLQNDFCLGGALAVPDADATLAVANRAIAASQAAGVAIVASQDWHPDDGQGRYDPITALRLITGFVNSLTRLLRVLLNQI